MSPINNQYQHQQYPYADSSNANHAAPQFMLPNPAQPNNMPSDMYDIQFENIDIGPEKRLGRPQAWL